MKWFLHKLAMMFGADPRKAAPTEETDAAREMKRYKKTPEQVQKRKCRLIRSIFCARARTAAACC